MNHQPSSDLATPSDTTKHQLGQMRVALDNSLSGGLKFALSQEYTSLTQLPPNVNNCIKNHLHTKANALARGLTDTPTFTPDTLIEDENITAFENQISELLELGILPCLDKHDLKKVLFQFKILNETLLDITTNKESTYPGASCFLTEDALLSEKGEVSTVSASTIDNTKLATFIDFGSWQSLVDLTEQQFLDQYSQLALVDNDDNPVEAIKKKEHYREHASQLWPFLQNLQLKLTQPSFLSAYYYYRDISENVKPVTAFNTNPEMLKAFERHEHNPYNFTSSSNARRLLFNIFTLKPVRKLFSKTAQADRAHEKEVKHAIKVARKREKTEKKAQQPTMVKTVINGIVVIKYLVTVNLEKIIDIGYKDKGIGTIDEDYVELKPLLRRIPKQYIALLTGGLATAGGIAYQHFTPEGYKIANEPTVEDIAGLDEFDSSTPITNNTIETTAVDGLKTEFNYGPIPYPALGPPTQEFFNQKAFVQINELNEAIRTFQYGTSLRFTMFNTGEEILTQIENYNKEVEEHNNEMKALNNEINEKRPILQKFARQVVLMCQYGNGLQNPVDYTKDDLIKLKNQLMSMPSVSNQTSVSVVDTPQFSATNDASTFPTGEPLNESQQIGFQSSMPIVGDNIVTDGDTEDNIVVDENAKSATSTTEQNIDDMTPKQYLDYLREQRGKR